jgi:hypothetical protein
MISESLRRSRSDGSIARRPVAFWGRENVIFVLEAVVFVVVVVKIIDND